MRGTPLLLALLALSAGAGEAGKVKNAIFGGLFNAKHAKHHHAVTDAEQAELAEWLTGLGYAKYASKEFIGKLDEELAADSISDMVDLMDDDEYAEVGMRKEDAEAISKAATREMLKRFLASVPAAPGSPAGTYAPYLDKLLAANYDDPDDIADLEEDEGVQIGLTSEQVAHLVTWADEFEGRETLRFLLTTYRPPDAGPNPFAADAVWKPMMESLVKAGVRSIVDLGRLSAADVPAVKAEDMAKLLSDPRVVASRGKQEL